VLLLVVADLFFLAAVVFRLRLDYTLEPAWIELPLLAAPRLVAGLGSGIVLALLRSCIGYAFALLAYGAFLHWSFGHYEAYVDWSDVRAIARAVVPYVVGLIGMSVGIFAGRAFFASSLGAGVKSIFTNTPAR
jgi:hypothetical protein